ncbi:Nin one binding Zn-ribbon like-domain-containing protein [Xylariaceae sp. FL0804]|nr:Nin one binding Zn-ribbon like-domain-containing protein [Xylariaceae sp. FL0804]
MADSSADTTPAQNAPNAAAADDAPETATPAPPSSSPPAKPIHSLVLDAGPLIKNDPPVSSLLARAHALYTLPSVLEAEVRDAASRARVDATLRPFVTLRTPRPDSVRHVVGFARRTGDLEVLSRTDVQLVALAYELEVERNGGDWRLRNAPGQKRINGRPPGREGEGPEKGEGEQQEEGEEEIIGEGEVAGEDEQVNYTVSDGQEGADEATEDDASAAPAQTEAEEVPREGTDIAPVEEDPDFGWEQVPKKKSSRRPAPAIPQETITQALGSMSLEPSALPTVDFVPDDAATAETKAHDEAEDDDDGWITPSNLKKRQAKDQLSAPDDGSLPPNQQPPRVLQAALLTSDFAMQNVSLRMGLNLVSPSLARITRVKTWVQRCHGCFALTRDASRQFCPRCGQATLTRVSCSTDAATGAFTVHLKTKNFQWKTRGNVYSVPKPVHGTASGKAPPRTKGGKGTAGGKGGWGTELILAEDEKEYAKKTAEQGRRQYRDLMDEDYLPGILTGYRQADPGRIRVGAGRNVNAKKRR